MLGWRNPDNVAGSAADSMWCGEGKPLNPFTGT